MSNQILTKFEEYVPVEITPIQMKTLILLMYSFETRQKHPQALNTMMLGVDKIFFTTQDKNNLFDCFDYTEADIKSVINKCPVINQSFKVISDPFNLFTIWCVHNTLNSAHLKDNEKYDLNMALLKMMHYKFFTSFVNQSYPHGATEAIMKAVVNNLSAKFDLVEYGSWKGVVEGRCNELLSPSSIHEKTLKQFNDDKNVLYILSDSQTRVRNRVKIINKLYYEAKQRSDTGIENRSLNSEVDGNSLIKDLESTYDTMSTNISNEALNINQWIDNINMRIVITLFPNINQTLIKQFLTAFATRAAMQNKTNDLDKVVISKDGRKTYIGTRALIKFILQKTYRSCIQSKVNMSSKTAILQRTRTMYSASRIADSDILNIKDSLSAVLQDTVKVSREATLASLRVGFITYLMLKSFNYI